MLMIGCVMNLCFLRRESAVSSRRPTLAGPIALSNDFQIADLPSRLQPAAALPYRGGAAWRTCSLAPCERWRAMRWTSMCVPFLATARRLSRTENTRSL
jgi:hypothetical protein